MCHIMSVVVRERLAGVSSLLPSDGYWRTNSGPQPWWQLHWLSHLTGPRSMALCSFTAPSLPRKMVHFGHTQDSVCLVCELWAKGNTVHLWGQHKKGWSKRIMNLRATHLDCYLENKNLNSEAGWKTLHSSYACTLFLTESSQFSRENNGFFPLLHQAQSGVSSLSGHFGQGLQLPAVLFSHCVMGVWYTLHLVTRR